MAEVCVSFSKVEHDEREEDITVANARQPFYLGAHTIY